MLKKILIYANDKDQAHSYLLRLAGEFFSASGIDFDKAKKEKHVPPTKELLFEREKGIEVIGYFIDAGVIKVDSKRYEMEEELIKYLLSLKSRKAFEKLLKELGLPTKEQKSDTNEEPTIDTVIAAVIKRVKALAGDDFDEDKAKNIITSVVKSVREWHILSKNKQFSVLIDSPDKIRNVIFRVSESVLSKEFDLDVEELLRKKEAGRAGAEFTVEKEAAEDHVKDQTLVYVLGSPQQTYNDLLKIKELLSKNTNLVVYIVAAKTRGFSYLDDQVDSRVTVKEFDEFLERADLLALRGFVDSKRLIVKGGVEKDDEKEFDLGLNSELVEPGEYEAIFRGDKTVTERHALPLVGRNPNSRSAEAGDEIIKAALRKKEKFAVAFMDVDAITKYHFGFGRHFKLAGKVRLIIEDSIKEVNKKHENNGVRVEQASGHGDESVIIITGISNQEEVEAILDRIRKEVVRQSIDRLAVAELENISLLHSKYFEEIRELLNYDLVKHNNKYSLMFDIRQEKTPQESLERVLETVNAVLLKRRGMTIRAKAPQVIPAMSVSMGAVIHGQSKASKTEDEALKEIKEETSRLLRESKDSGTNIVSTQVIGRISKGISPKTVNSASAKGKKAEYKAGSFPEEIVSILNEKFDHPEGIESLLNRIAILVLKGGELGGLDYDVRKVILERLQEDYDVFIGRRTNLSPSQVLTVWGDTGITQRLKLLRSSLPEASKGLVSEAIKYVEARDGARFAAWIKAREDDVEAKADSDQKSDFDNANFAALTFLWYYLREDVQLLVLKRKSPRLEILAKYGFSEQTAKDWLKNKKGWIVNRIDDLSEQDFLNIIGGNAQTLENTDTLRGEIGYQMLYGFLKNTAKGARSMGVPYTALYASANGMHIPWQSELEKEKEIWEQEIKVVLNKTHKPYSPLAPPTTDINDLESAYEPDSSISNQYRNPQEIAQLLSERAGTLSRGLSDYQIYLLQKRVEFFINSINSAYTTNDTYTYYHSLVAISEFLKSVAIELAKKKDALNVYIARDAANYWQAGYLSATDKTVFKENNKVFHLSRARLDVAHSVMIALLKGADEEAEKGNFWKSLTMKFAQKVNEDREFRAIADEVYKKLKTVINGHKDIRFVESMAQGIMTAFLKALVIYKDKLDKGKSDEKKRNENNIEEFIVAPKEDKKGLEGLRAKGRTITTIIDESKPKAEAVRGWFERHGLEFSGEIVQEAKSDDDGVNINKIFLDLLEAQIYHAFYPSSEVNLGHPIEFDGKNLVKSSAVKQLGFVLRQVLLMNALSDNPGFKFSELGSEAETVNPNDFLPAEYKLLGKGEELFNFIVEAHNEVFSTAPDRDQEELLVKLAGWVNLMAEQIETGKMAEFIEEIKAAHGNSEYFYQFERFLFELREFETFEPFHLSLSWLVGREGSKPEDFYKENAIAKSANALRSLREKVAVEKRKLPTSLRITNFYGHESQKQEEIAELGYKSVLVDLFEAKATTEAAEETSPAVDKDSHMRYFIGVLPSFEVAEGKNKRKYSYQELITKFGNEKAKEYLEKWQDAIEKEFAGGWVMSVSLNGKNYALTGKRGSMLFYA
ncbi:MAG: hypothetical protein WCY34_04940, partial [Candidatus Omnitrophota bacterium]